MKKREAQINDVIVFYFVRNHKIDIFEHLLVIVVILEGCWVKYDANRALLLLNVLDDLVNIFVRHLALADHVFNVGEDFVDAVLDGTELEVFHGTVSDNNLVLTLSVDVYTSAAGRLLGFDEEMADTFLLIVIP